MEGLPKTRWNLLQEKGRIMDLSNININEIPIEEDLDALDLTNIQTIEQPQQHLFSYDPSLEKPLSDLDFGDVLQTGMNAGKEVIGLAQMLGKATLGTGKALLDYKETIKNSPSIMKSVAKNTPSIAKNIISEFTQSFGDIPDSGVLEISVDRAFDRFKEKPISTFMDWMVPIGVAKGAIKLGVKNVDKLLDTDMLNIFKKNIDDLDEFAKITGVKPKTQFQDVIERKEIIRNLSGKQLNEKDTVGQFGRMFAKNIDEVVKKENMRLDGAVKFYADNPINKNNMYNDFSKAIQQKGLESVPIKDSNAVKLMNKIAKGSDVTVGEVHQLRRSVAGNINYNNPLPEDKVLIELNRALKNEMVSGRPEIVAPLERIHNRLEKFQGLEQKLKTSGGGERLAQNFFNTREELEDLVQVLGTIPEAGKALTGLKSIDAWNKWNAYVGKNADILPRYLNPNQPFLIPVRELSEAGRTVKGRLATNVSTGVTTRTLNKLLTPKKMATGVQLQDKFTED